MATAVAQQSSSRGVASSPALQNAPEPALEKIQSWIDSFYALLPNLAVAAVLFVIILLLAWSAKWTVRRWAARRGRGNLGDVLGAFVRWMLIGAGLLVTATIVLPSVRPVDLLAGLGIGSVAIGFAFKDILQNWLAGLLLLLRQPFRVGDQIIVKDFEGTVERIETRSTNIKTYDGRRVIIPNSDVFSNAVVVNTAFATRRSQYDVGIGMGDDAGGACEAILQAIQTLEGVERTPMPEVLPWAIDPYQLTLRVRWWTHSRRTDVVHVHSRVVAAIKEALDAAGIDMPFPTEVHLIHDQTDEYDGIRGKQREGWPEQKGKRAPRPVRLLREERLQSEETG